MLIQYKSEECGPFTLSLVQCTLCPMRGASMSEPMTILLEINTVEDKNGFLVPKNFDDWFSVVSLAGASFEGENPGLSSRNDHMISQALFFSIKFYSNGY